MTQLSHSTSGRCCTCCGTVIPSSNRCKRLAAARAGMFSLPVVPAMTQDATQNSAHRMCKCICAVSLDEFSPRIRNL